MSNRNTRRPCIKPDQRAIAYRKLAENQREEACIAELATVRQKHLNSAEKWELLAEEMEMLAGPASLTQPETATG